MARRWRCRESGAEKREKLSVTRSCPLLKERTVRPCCIQLGEKVTPMSFFFGS